MAIAQTRSREIQLFEPAQNPLHTRKCRAAPFSKPITVLYVNDDQSNAFDKYKVGTRNMPTRRCTPRVGGPRCLPKRRRQILLYEVRPTNGLA